MERGEWDEESEYPRAPLPAHERTWRHPSEQGASAWVRSEPPLVVGKGLSVATGTVGAVLAVGLLWLMIPHDNRGGGGVAQVSSTVHTTGNDGGSATRPTAQPLSIVSSVMSTEGSIEGTAALGTTSKTFASSTAGPIVGVETSASDEPTSDTSPSAAGTGAPQSSASTVQPSSSSGTGPASSTGATGSTQTSAATPSSGPTVAGGTTSSSPPSSATTTSAPATSAPGNGSGGVAYAVALAPGHFVASTAAAVGSQSSVNVQLPTGDTVMGDVVSVSNGVAVLSIPSDVQTTPIATADPSATTSGATAMSPEPTPVSVWRDGAGTQISYDPAAEVAEAALVLDNANRLIGMCTWAADGPHIVDAQDLLDAINGAIANEGPAWLGLKVSATDLSVIDVSADGPAAAAGIAIGDVIRAVDGAPVGSVDAMRAAVQSHHPGETIVLSVEKVGTTAPVDVPAVLARNPGSL